MAAPQQSPQPARRGFLERAGWVGLLASATCLAPLAWLGSQRLPADVLTPLAASLTSPPAQSENHHSPVSSRVGNDPALTRAFAERALAPPVGLPVATTAARVEAPLPPMLRYELASASPAETQAAPPGKSAPAAAEKLPAEKLAAVKPRSEKPGDEQSSAADKPATEKPVTEKPAAEKAATEKATTDKPQKVLLRGEVVLLAEALRQRGVKTYAEEIAQQAVLRTATGELIPLVPDWRGRAFSQDERLRGRPVELVVNRRVGVPWVSVLSIYGRDDAGQRSVIDYWCDVCAIPMYEIKDCECCQGPIRLRFRPQSLPRDVPPATENSPK